MTGWLRLTVQGAGACLLVACGAATAEDTSVADQPIFGGLPTAECEWEAVAFLDDRCTGTFVAPNVIVYAAHCGESVERAWTGSETIPVSWCSVFPDFGLGTGTDVAFCVTATKSRHYLPV